MGRELNEIRDGDLMTTGDAAKALGVTPGAVAKMDRLGRLRAMSRTAGGLRLFWTREVAALAKERARVRAKAAEERA